jgi:hypothetical protein
MGGDSIRIRHHGEAPSPLWFWSWRLTELVDVLERQGVRIVRLQPEGGDSHK